MTKSQPRRGMAGLSASFTDGHGKYAILAAFAGSRVQAATDILLPKKVTDEWIPSADRQEIRKPRERSTLQKTLRFCTPFFLNSENGGVSRGHRLRFQTLFLRQAHAVRTPCGEKICFLSRMISVSKPNDSPFRLTIVKNRP